MQGCPCEDIGNRKMKKQALQAVAQEVSRRLKLETVAGPTVDHVLTATIVDLWLRHTTEAVAEYLLTKSDPDPCMTEEDGPVVSLEARLEKVEQKLQKLALLIPDDGEPATAGSTLANLKDAKPKYEGVESILKYVEAGDDKSALRLVIMNFND